jgi:hypothetical protein
MGRALAVSNDRRAGEAGEQRLERLRERASTRAGPGVQRDCRRKKKGRQNCRSDSAERKS